MKLEIGSIIDKGEFKGKKVCDILSENKKDIFKLIKEGVIFSDEVLEKAGIKKNIHSVSTKNSIVEHDNSELLIKLEVDKIDISTLINEIIIKSNPKLSSDDSEKDESSEDKIIEDEDDFNISEDDI